MPDLLGLSDQIIDSGQVHTPPVRTTRELSEVAAGSGAFVADARGRQHSRPTFTAAAEADGA
jgi:hypothetical protein